MLLIAYLEGITVILYCLTYKSECENIGFSKNSQFDNYDLVRLPHLIAVLLREKTKFHSEWLYEMRNSIKSVFSKTGAWEQQE